MCLFAELRCVSQEYIQCCTANLCDLASEGPDFVMYQLKSSYNSPFENSYSYLIHTCFTMIASIIQIIESKEISFIYTTALSVQSKMHVLC